VGADSAALPLPPFGDAGGVTSGSTTRVGCLSSLASVATTLSVVASSGMFFAVTGLLTLGLVFFKERDFTAPRRVLLADLSFGASGGAISFSSIIARGWPAFTAISLAKSWCSQNFGNMVVRIADIAAISMLSKPEMLKSFSTTAAPMRSRSSPWKNESPNARPDPSHTNCSKKRLVEKCASNQFG
jgi:hypothetical protein